MAGRQLSAQRGSDRPFEYCAEARQGSGLGANEVMNDEGRMDRMLGQQDVDVSRRGSKVHLEDEERKVQQE